MTKVINLNDKYNTQYEILFVPTGEWTKTFNFWVTKRSDECRGSTHSVLIFMSKTLSNYHFKKSNEENAGKLYKAIIDFDNQFKGWKDRKACRIKLI